MKTFKKLTLVIALFAFTFIFTACSANSSDNDKIAPEKANYPVTITDSLEEAITIEDEPKTIVTLAPNITEIVYALGLGDMVVGRNAYSDYPEEALEVEVIGDFYSINLERIVELDPDIVIASTHFEEEMQAKFDDIGVQVITLYDSTSFDGVYTSIETLGRVFNVQDKASEVIDEIKNQVADVEEKVKNEEKPSVYYVVGYGQEGDYTATGDTFIHEMLTMAGGENIAKDVAGWTYSKETLMEKDPDIVIVKKDFYDDFIASEGYKELSAVKNNKVYTIDNNLLDRPGPRSGLGVIEIAKILHPELFK
ncbi:ABC transporter substrate-binding protein [Alloiococcus sp. CFN-8]|uniref:ABC transporter substrate-binding protein n=1 Tax=Alloiococcus sp. CFN-8 TaxID=3416081 RepID=UPI003CE8768C